MISPLLLVAAAIIVSAAMGTFVYLTCQTAGLPVPLPGALGGLVGGITISKILLGNDTRGS
jgi:hypothetical protein